jgi:hypothetical protein
MIKNTLNALGLFLLFAIAIAGSAQAMGLTNLEGFEQLFGRYAPAGDCKRQPHIVVAKTGFTFEVAGQTETATQPEYAASYGGNFYEGISLWFFPYFDADKDRPLLLTFNANEQTGVLVVDTEYNYPGGPKLPAKYQALVDGSPYAICR